MSTIDLLGLTLSFYGTMPPPRPPRPNRNGATWAAAVIFGAVCIATIGPMITIWSFHRPYAEAKARCIASGGRVLYGALDGSGPYRCERPAAAAAAAAIAHPAKPAD
ncbi:hypothetical protein LOK46_03890 [Methylobacterium sp. NMS14P]|uniref:hypothetical protein n=1 Tax=unclassified Methylobacterium TaxID=2615210 RepID=UPI002358F5F0|nr:hypothetical protein [Methylobacterium sp. NMS14P]WCS25988.1 hypothetical protein LOK46_03890 [Methylobacterium sp. NMS14P]